MCSGTKAMDFLHIFLKGHLMQKLHITKLCASNYPDTWPEVQDYCDRSITEFAGDQVLWFSYSIESIPKDYMPLPGLEPFKGREYNDIGVGVVQ
jgi:hypothetical protein